MSSISFHRPFFLLFLAITITSGSAGADDHTLSDRLAELAAQVKAVIQNDRELENVNQLRLERIDSEGIGDANYDLRIRTELGQHLQGILSDSATSFLKVTYAYIEGETPENSGKRIIQLSAKLTIRGKRTILKTLEALEVNNSSDVSSIVASLVSFTGDDNGAKRLQKIEQAFEHPRFVTKESQLSLSESPQYALEIRASSDPRGKHSPINLTTLHGLPFVDIPLHHTYEIALFNYDEKNDVVVNIEIDGLSAINTFNRDVVRYPGYFVDHASNGQPGVHVVPGWMHTVENKTNAPRDNVFQFVVNELGKGAATQMRSTGEIGIIHTKWHQARSANNPAGRFAGETGVGRPMPVDYEVVDVDIVPQPVANISIRYTHPK